MNVPLTKSARHIEATAAMVAMYEAHLVDIGGCEDCLSDATSLYGEARIAVCDECAREREASDHGEEDYGDDVEPDCGLAAE